MKRIGWLTGTVYDGNVDVSDIPECATIIPDNMDDDKDYIQMKQAEGKIRCSCCPGACPLKKERR